MYNSTIAIRDEKGVPIQDGDVLRVFHFIGAMRKRYYMYKVVSQVDGHLRAMHLGKLSPDESDGYWLRSVVKEDGRIPGTLVVQSDRDAIV